MLPGARMVARQAAAREIVHPELGANGRLFTPLPGAFTTSSDLINLFPNPNFEHDNAGAQGAGLETGNGNVVTAATFAGSNGTKVLATRTDASGWLIRQLVPSPCTVGVSYTASVRYQQQNSNTNGWDLLLEFLLGDGGTVVGSSQTHVGNVGNGTTGVASAVGVAPATAVLVRIRISHSTDISAMRFDGFMIVPTAQGATYGDGDTANWSWAGTPGNSISNGPITHVSPTGVSKYGQAGWAYDITEAAVDGGAQTQDWDLVRVLRNSGLFAEADGPAPYRVTTLPGFSQWLDASQLTSKVDGNAVSAFTDMSGFGNDAVQATGSLQPLYKTNIIGSLPGVLFDGTDDTMSIAGLLNNKPNRTVFIVVKVVASGALAGMVRLGSNAASIASGNGGNFLYAENQATSNVVIGTQNTSPHILAIRYNATNSADLYYDHGAAANFDPSDAYQSGSSGWTLGGSQGGFFSNFYLMEQIVCDATLSDANVVATQSYLGSKYGI